MTIEIMYDHLQSSKEYSLPSKKWRKIKPYWFPKMATWNNRTQIKTLIVTTYLPHLSKVQWSKRINRYFIHNFTVAKPSMNVENVEWSLQVYPVAWLPSDKQATPLSSHLKVVLRSPPSWTKHRWSLNSLSALISVSF